MTHVPMMKTIPLALLLLSAGCSHILPRQDTTLADTGPVDTVGDGLVKAFVNAYEISYDESVVNRPSTSEESRRAAAIHFLNTGLTLAHFRCSEFMTDLGKRQQRFDLAQGATVVASTATTGVMGLTGVDPKTMGLVAAAFGTLLAGGEVYQHVALFNPDTRAVQILVAKAMDVHAQEAREQTDGADYDYLDAMRSVLDAQTLCQVESVKSLVDKAIKDSELEATPTTHRDELKEKFTKTETKTETTTTTIQTGDGEEIESERTVEMTERESDEAAISAGIDAPTRSRTRRGGFDIRVR